MDSHQTPSRTDTRPESSRPGAVPLGVLTVALGFLVIDCSIGSQASTGYLAAFLLSLSAFWILALHIADKNLDPITHMVSEYSVDPPHGDWMKTAFFSLGVGIGTIAYASHHYLKMGGWFTFFTAIAALGPIGMGIFSMRTLAPDEAHSTIFDGTVHDICCGVSFAFAIVTMAIFAYDPTFLVWRQDSWLRAVALEQFNIAVISAIFFWILGISKVKVIQSIAPNYRFRDLVKDDFRRTRTSGQTGRHCAARKLQGQSDAKPNPQSDELTRAQVDEPAEDRARTDAVKATNKGLGLMERILIFLFLEWTFVLTGVVFIRQVPVGENQPKLQLNRASPIPIEGMVTVRRD